MTHEESSCDRDELAAGGGGRNPVAAAAPSATRHDLQLGRRLFHLTVLLTILAAPKPAALIAIYTLAIADPLAAVVGIR
jgi:dolichol kinase